MGLTGSTVWSLIYAVVIVIMLVILVFLGLHWLERPRSTMRLGMVLTYGIGALITYTLYKTLSDCKEDQLELVKKGNDPEWAIAVQNYPTEYQTPGSPGQYSTPGSPPGQYPTPGSSGTITV